MQILCTEENDLQWRILDDFDTLLFSLAKRIKWLKKNLFPTFVVHYTPLSLILTLTKR